MTFFAFALALADVVVATAAGLLPLFLAGLVEGLLLLVIFYAAAATCGATFAWPAMAAVVLALLICWTTRGCF